MRRILSILVVALGLTLGFGGVAVAQSGHFVQTQNCRDTGLTVTCSGKVAGLGGTTFEIQIIADGVASVECANPAGNVAPGQDFEFTAEGTTGTQTTPRNGQFRYTVSTRAPSAPADSCPNPQWTATVVDVSFTTATLNLLEGGQLSDSVTVPVS